MIIPRYERAPLLLFLALVMASACGHQQGSEERDVEAGAKAVPEPAIAERKEALRREVLEEVRASQAKGDLDGALERLSASPWLRADPEARSLRAQIEQEATAQAREPGFLLKLVGGQGQVDFVLAGEEIARHPRSLEKRLRALCDARRGDWCKMLVWVNQRLIPHGLPMSARSLAAQIAQYDRNRSTGYDCFFQLAEGAMIDSSRSGTCSSSR